MPIPLMLVAAAAGAAAFGLKKGFDANKDNQEAEAFNDEARTIFESAKNELEKERNSTSAILQDLGRMKLNAWNCQLTHFVQSFEKIRNVEFSGQVQVGNLNFSKNEFVRIKEMSLKVKEVMTGGAAALSGGVLAGIAAYGGATMLATASTGTAISALAGAAAANATLAWFGGGALAAGGMGIAGGMAVLGGIVAGPVLAIGGLLLAKRAEKNRAEAESALARVKVEVAEMEKASILVKTIGEVGKEFSIVIHGVARRMDTVLNKLDKLIETSGTDYLTYSDAERKLVYANVQFAQILKLLLETPILTKDGALDKNYHRALIQGKKFL